MTSNRPKAIATKQLENDRVIITEWRFAPGAETGWHKHGYDYIVVPGLDGNLLLESSDDEITDDVKNSHNIIETLAELTAGQSYFKSIGVEHNVVNANDFEFHFVEIELK
ncbi:MAG: quercetin dioxygenase-like cupin family protein [Cocleimonas sp.]|jgi:quercetin dioxygenase-like cupin family protein